MVNAEQRRAFEDTAEGDDFANALTLFALRVRSCHRSAFGVTDDVDIAAPEVVANCIDLGGDFIHAIRHRVKAIETRNQPGAVAVSAVMGRGSP